MSDSESDSGGMEWRHEVSDVGELVRSIVLEGYGEELAWLQAYLSDEARDRRIDGTSQTHTHTHTDTMIVVIDEWEDLCVVAVSESVATAMRTELFERLLTQLSLQPPSKQVNGRMPAS